MPGGKTTDNPTEQVGWVRGYGPVSEDRVYHVDEDCAHLQNSNNYREAEPWEMDELDGCQYCVGSWHPDTTSDGHYESLVKAAREAP